MAIKKFILISPVILAILVLWFVFGYRNDKDYSFIVPVHYSRLDNIRIDYKFKNNIFELNSSNYKVIDRTKKVHYNPNKGIEYFFNTGNFKKFNHTLESFALYLFVETKLNKTQQYRNCSKQAFFTIIVDVENRKTNLFCRNHQGEDISQDFFLVNDEKDMILYRVILENYLKSVEK